MKNWENLINLVVSGVVVIIGLLIWRAIKAALLKYIHQKQDKGELDTRERRNAQALLFNAIKTILIVIIALSVMQINGINISSLVAGLGIFSAVIGLALQDLLKDVIMGVHILSDDFFKVGDVVQYKGEEGVVISFNLRTTKLRSIADNDLITICNRNISEITQSSDRLFVPIPFPYEEPVGTVREAVSEIAARVRKLDGVTECTELGLTDFQDSDLVYKLAIVCAPTVKLTVKRFTQQAIYEVFLEHSIDVPYPQIDVHVSGGA